MNFRHSAIALRLWRARRPAQAECLPHVNGIDAYAIDHNIRMTKLLLISNLLLMVVSGTALYAQSQEIRIIAFGAHPDDCDIRASGTAALWTKLGYKVKFVSVTNGDAGHQTMHGRELAKRRLAEAKESARRQGIEYDV